MIGNEPIYYWDACLFLAWLKDERGRKPGEMDGVREYIDKIKRREIKIMTSVITFTEVISARVPIGVEGLFQDVFKQTNVGKISVDIKIARMARELRDYYTGRASEYGNKTLSVPDALHLATAILYRAKEFHTFDEDNKKNLGLIPLSGNVAGHPLVITKPIASIPTLDFR